MTLAQMKKRKTDRMTWREKYVWLKKEIERYNEFLFSGTPLTFTQRVSVSQEITRLNAQREKIKKMPMANMDLVCDDYNIEETSKLNNGKIK